MNERLTTAGPILVAGCGSIGSRHLRNLARLGAGPLLVHDADEQRARAVAAEVGATALASIARAPHLGAALICTPTNQHLEPAMATLDRGAHLFIEKPIAATMDGVRELVAAAHRLDRTVMVGFNLRFHPCLQRVKSLIDDGDIGRPLGARIQFGQYLPDWHPREDYRQGYSARRALGGGIVLDAVHELDYARWLLGEVRTVTGMAGRVGGLEIDTEDVGAFVLRHESGAISEIHVDYLQRVYARTCEVFGTDGTIQWNWSAQNVRCYRAGRGSWEEFPEPRGYDVNDSYVQELRAFFAAIDGGRPPVDGHDGARVLAIALAAKEAAASGRAIDV